MSKLKDELVDAAYIFTREWYLKTEAELRRDWIENTTNARALHNCAELLKRDIRESVAAEFAGHSPMYEYARAFLFGGEEFDVNLQRKFPMSEYYLYEPLHKDIICRTLESYLVGPPEKRAGLAIFITRFGLKTYLVVLNASSWLLTRHRVIFDDFTTIRIICDVLDEAVKRADDIKRLHQNCKPLIELYPEVRIPEGRWMNENAWDLDGREKSASKSLDPSIRALGSGSSEQGSHPVYTIFDDMESKAHSRSSAIREETSDYFQAFKFSTKMGGERNLLVGTFYHPASVHAKLVEATDVAEAAGGTTLAGSWRIIKLPGILDEGTPQARPLYPTRLGLDVLESKRQQEILADGDDINWRMNIMLDFKTSAKYAFDMQRWREFDPNHPADERETELIKALDNAPRFVFSDFAGKNDSTKGDGDYNASWLLAFPRLDGQVQIVALDCEYDDTSTLDEAGYLALDMASANNAWGMVPEESPSHKVVGQMLHRLSMERGYRYYQRLGKNGKNEGNISSLTPRASATQGMGSISSWKMGRMKKLQGAWNAGHVWLASHIAALPAFRQQIIDFPFCKPDDLLDAFSLSQDERVADLVPTARVREVRRFEQPSVPAARYTGLTRRRW